MFLVKFFIQDTCIFHVVKSNDPHTKKIEKQNPFEEKEQHFAILFVCLLLDFSVWIVLVGVRVCVCGVSASVRETDRQTDRQTGGQADSRAERNREGERDKFAVIYTLTTGHVARHRLS